MIGVLVEGIRIRKKSYCGWKWKKGMIEEMVVMFEEICEFKGEMEKEDEKKKMQMKGRVVDDEGIIDKEKRKKIVKKIEDFEEK